MKIDDTKYVLSKYPHITETSDDDVKKFLSTLSNENLERIVIDYSWIFKPVGFDDVLMCPSDHTFINPIDARPINEVVSYTSSHFDLLPKQIRSTNTPGGVCKIRICIPLINKNLKIIKRHMKCLGYNLRTPVEQIHHGQFAWLLFEYRPLKDDTDRIRKEETTLYFLLPYCKIGMIRHLGFSPKAKNELFDCPRRLYFLKGSTSKEDIKRICTLKRNVNPNISNIDRFALYTIDLNKIPSDAKLYLDPSNSYGIYTHKAIPQDAIINIEELKI